MIIVAQLLTESSTDTGIITGKIICTTYYSERKCALHTHTKKWIFYSFSAIIMLDIIQTIRDKTFVLFSVHYPCFRIYHAGLAILVAMFFVTLLLLMGVIAFLLVYIYKSHKKTGPRYGRESECQS